MCQLEVGAERGEHGVGGERAGWMWKNHDLFCKQSGEG